MVETNKGARSYSTKVNYCCEKGKNKDLDSVTCQRL